MPDISQLPQLPLQQLNVYDAVLLLLIFGFTVYGFIKGIIRMAGDFVGYLVGIWVAGYYFLPFYQWTYSLYRGNENAGKIISFFLLLFITRKLISLVVMLVDRFLGILNIIPFFGMLNRLAGAVLGFLSASIVIGTLVYFASRYSLGFDIDKWLAQSRIAGILFKVGDFISPLLPEMVRQLNSLL